jgi:NADP-dependent 3-hydroxy acid dehydrogenase YdfG
LTNQSQSRVAWVTGGSAGIGLAIARVLAEDGFHVVLSARNAAMLESACAEIRAAGGSAEYAVADVTDRIRVNAVVGDILARHGRIDLLVNNAGFNSQKREWDDLIPEEFDAVIASNITGTFNATYAVLPTMRERKDGLVVNISSGAGKQVGVGAGVAYTIAKHGTHIMTKLLNQTELKNGIRACVIAPGFVKTRLQDWRPQEMHAYMLDPTEVARAVRFAVESPPHTAIFEIELGWSPV